MPAHVQCKESDRKETRTNITRLSEEQRVAEIARMLGGIEITDQTLNHARDMVERARSA